MISTLYANRWTSCMELCTSSYLQFPGHLMSGFNRVSLKNMADLSGFPCKHGRFSWVSLENMADLLTFSLDALSSIPAGYIETFPVTNTCQPGYYRWSKFCSFNHDTCMKWRRCIRCILYNWIIEERVNEWTNIIHFPFIMCCVLLITVNKVSYAF